MNIRSTVKFATVISTALFSAGMVFAQDDTKTRSITSDDFATQRPAASTVQKAVRRTYNRSSHAAPVPHKVRQTPPKPPKGAVIKTTEIGVTMWKLRPPKTGEAGYLMPVVDDQKMRQMWLAERVDIDSIFKAGDKIRFAVESSETAYLYVLDRELYADGTYGDPFMIFPESARDDNTVGPGTLVDIPDQREDAPYFNMTPKNANYKGEILTVIISPTPLTSLKTNLEGKVINVEDLTKIEYSGESELFTRVDAADKIYSKTESESACGTKTRQISGKSGQPCGVKTRQLTREEAMPQSIFRFKGPTGQPAVAFVKLGVN